MRPRSVSLRSQHRPRGATLLLSGRTATTFIQRHVLRTPGPPTSPSRAWSWRHLRRSLIGPPHPRACAAGRSRRVEGGGGAVTGRAARGGGACFLRRVSAVGAGPGRESWSWGRGRGGDGGMMMAYFVESFWVGERREPFPRRSGWESAGGRRGARRRGRLGCGAAPGTAVGPGERAGRGGGEYRRGARRGGRRRAVPCRAPPRTALGGCQAGPGGRAGDPGRRPRLRRPSSPAVPDNTPAAARAAPPSARCLCTGVSGGTAGSGRPCA